MDFNLSKFFPGDSENLVISKWFFITRAVGSLVIGSGVFLLSSFHVVSFSYKPIIFGLIPLYFAVSFLWLIIAIQKTWNGRFLSLQLLVDVLAVTIGLYFSGGTHSEFVYIYLMVTLSAAVISLRAVLAVSFTSIAFYLTLILLEQLKIIAPAPGSHWGFHTDEVLRIAVYLIITIIVAFQGHFYISRIKKKDEELLKMKDEFLFHTVHAMRSPEIAVRWIIESCSRAGFLDSYPDLKGIFSTLTSLNARIRQLIDDVMTIARGKQVAIKKEKVNVASIIEQIASNLKPSMEKKSLRFSHKPMEPMPQILADCELVRDIFENLIDNAAKYNKIGGSISVAYELEQGFLKTEVRDTGIGISADNLPKIFIPYFRVGGRAPESTGLGLYIVKTLVEKMRGKISAESALGQGTAFKVSLPVVES